MGRHKDNVTALPLVLPFVLVYALLFLYPTGQMVWMSLTDAQLIRQGEFVGAENYLRLFDDWRFWRSVSNTAYFIALTVVPSTALGLALAMMVNRLKGWPQAVALAVFFLPYVLPVSTVIMVWGWLFNETSGPLQLLVEAIAGKRLTVTDTPVWVIPIAAATTVWWTVGFNVLLFLAGLKNIPQELYEASRIDGADRWAQFRSLTWPLIWPVTALVLTIQLITQVKVFDQVYLLVAGSNRVDPTMVLVQYIYTLAFARNQGGYAATVAVALFVLVSVMSVLQFQALRARGGK